MQRSPVGSMRGHRKPAQPASSAQAVAAAAASWQWRRAWRARGSIAGRRGGVAGLGAQAQGGRTESWC
jgi:hypothetical protein